jgi:hypothetical protein
MRRQPTGRGASRPAASTRPRYGRITAASAALLVTLVSLLGGLGVLPGEQATARPVEAPGASRPTAATPGSEPTGGAITLADGRTDTGSAPAATDAALPAGSGRGRRIVFDVTRQRVWLVGQRAGRDLVRRTYLVSGSVTDNLRPGTYSVYSKSRHAWGVDDSGTMRYMVRFAHGDRAAIGFHDIPVRNGAAVQTRAQLGTPQSHGCIRQWLPDARALWNFAPQGTKVVVVA